MKTYFLFLLLMGLLLSNTGFANAIPYALPRTDVIPITDSQTGGQYDLIVKLPENYVTDTDKTYPVIYTTDAIWHMELLSGTTEFLLPDVILVGISWQKNLPENIDYGHRRVFASRFKDYSFVAHEKPDIQAKYQFGQADKHVNFIQRQVIKYVESHYRTKPNANAYLGYSMGGEFGGYILLAKPSTFDFYILGSPSFDALSFDYLKSLIPEGGNQQTIKDAKVYLSIGELETDRIDITQQFAAMLEHKVGNTSAFNGLDVIKDSDHTTAVPETFMRSIKWLKRHIAKLANGTVQNESEKDDSSQ